MLAAKTDGWSSAPKTYIEIYIYVYTNMHTITTSEKRS